MFSCQSSQCITPLYWFPYWSGSALIKRPLFQLPQMVSWWDDTRAMMGGPGCPWTSNNIEKPDEKPWRMPTPHIFQLTGGRVYVIFNQKVEYEPPLFG